MDDNLNDPKATADYLGIPLQTLYRWRVYGKGPRAIKVGKHLRYRDSDIAAWLEANADPQTAA